MAIRTAFRAAAAALVISAGVCVPPVAAEIAGIKQRDGAKALLRGETDAAIASYTAALEDPAIASDRRATILNDRAVAYVRLGRTRLAIEDFNKAVELFPEYAPTYNNRGNLLVALGLHDEAVKDFNRAIVLAPGYAAAYNNRAGALTRMGQVDAAIEDYTQAIRLMPSGAAPLSGRGRAHLELGRPHAAIRDFSLAVATDARFASAYRSRAEARLDVAQTEAAIEDLSRAIAFDVNNPEIYELRGHAYLTVGNLEAAVADFTRAIELSPGSSTGFEARGLAHAMGEAHEAALADLNRGIELNPRSAVAFAYRAYAYVRSGQPDVAERDVATAVKLAGEEPELLWARAEVEEALGRPDAAVEHLRRALELRPGFQRAVESLQRLGAASDFTADQRIAGLGGGGWEVVQNRGRFFAVNDDLGGIRVPLEMMGEGQPRVLAWQLVEPPFRDIGLLTYHSGMQAGPRGVEETEQAAIVDIRTRSIVSIQPNRRGEKTSNWTWASDGKVTVAAVDGVTDEFALRDGTRMPVAAGGPRRFSERDAYGGGPAWAPWADGGGFAPPGYERPRQRQAQRPRKQQKTLFQLLFGN